MARMSRFEEYLDLAVQEFLLTNEQPWMPDDQDTDGWYALVDEFYEEAEAAIWDRWCAWNAKHSVASAEDALAAQRHA